MRHRISRPNVVEAFTLFSVPLYSGEKTFRHLFAVYESISTSDTSSLLLNFHSDSVANGDKVIPIVVRNYAGTGKASDRRAGPRVYNRFDSITFIIITITRATNVCLVNISGALAKRGTNANGHALENAATRGEIFIIVIG